MCRYFGYRRTRRTRSSNIYGRVEEGSACGWVGGHVGGKGGSMGEHGAYDTCVERGLSEREGLGVSDTAACFGSSGRKGAGRKSAVCGSCRVIFLGG